MKWYGISSARENNTDFFLWYVNLFSFMCLCLTCFASFFLLLSFDIFSIFIATNERLFLVAIHSKAEIIGKRALILCGCFFYLHSTYAGWLADCLSARKRREKKANERFMDTCIQSKQHLRLLNRSNMR